MSVSGGITGADNSVGIEPPAEPPASPRSSREDPVEARRRARMRVLNSSPTYMFGVLVGHHRDLHDPQPERVHLGGQRCEHHPRRPRRRTW